MVKQILGTFLGLALGIGVAVGQWYFYSWAYGAGAEAGINFATYSILSDREQLCGEVGA